MPDGYVLMICSLGGELATRTVWVSAVMAEMVWVTSVPDLVAAVIAAPLNLAVLGRAVDLVNG